MSRALTGDRGDLAKAQEEAKHVQVDQLETNFAIAFLSFWANLLLINQEDMAGPILRLCRDLTTKQTPAEVLFLVDLIYSVYYRVVHGNLEQHADTLREAFARLGANSPRLAWGLFNYCDLYARGGKLKDCDQEFEKLRALADSGRFESLGVEWLRYENDIEHSVLSDFDRSNSQLDTCAFLARHKAEFRALNRLMTIILDGETDFQSGPLPEFLAAHPQLNCVARLLVSLRRGEREESLAWAREYARRENLETRLGFHAYDLIRAELANRNAEAARILLRKKMARNNHHFLDSFFLARVEVIAGNMAAAAADYAECLRAVKRYDFERRLDFELELAAELSAGDLVRLTRAVADPQTERWSRIEVQLKPKRGVCQGVGRLQGFCSGINAIRELVLKYAPSEITVLIVGETGVGKELVARALHEESQRTGKPFMTLNCGAIPENLLASDLFGHAKGAFTGAASARQGIFEAAEDGTVLLDEIGDLPLSHQVALLRVLENREIRPVGSSVSRHCRCRVLAATNADIETLIAQKQFRQDLYFRLRRLEIAVPLLRVRGEDILRLAALFLDEGRNDGVRAKLSADLRTALEHYKWPGNVRELKYAIERMRLMCSDKLFYDVKDILSVLPEMPGRLHYNFST